MTGGPAAVRIFLCIKAYRDQQRFLLRITALKAIRKAALLHPTFAITIFLKTILANTWYDDPTSQAIYP
jgi:hypothetical protein